MSFAITVHIEAAAAHSLAGRHAEAAEERTMAALLAEEAGAVNDAVIHFFGATDSHRRAGLASEAVASLASAKALIDNPKHSAGMPDYFHDLLKTYQAQINTMPLPVIPEDTAGDERTITEPPPKS